MSACALMHDLEPWYVNLTDLQSKLEASCKLEPNSPPPESVTSEASTVLAFDSQSSIWTNESGIWPEINAPAPADVKIRAERPTVGFSGYFIDDAIKEDAKIDGIAELGLGGLSKTPPHTLIALLSMTEGLWEAVGQNDEEKENEAPALENGSEFRPSPPAAIMSMPGSAPAKTSTSTGMTHVSPWETFGEALRRFNERERRGAVRGPPPGTWLAGPPPPGTWLMPSGRFASWSGPTDAEQEEDPRTMHKGRQ